jgi:hypothetical protein
MFGRNLFVHQVAVPASLGAVNSITVRLPEAYRLVTAFMPDYGLLVLPTADDLAYLVPLGADGLAYLGDLGAAGGTVSYKFSQSISYLIFVTYSAVSPIVDFVYLPRITGGSAPSDAYLPNGKFTAYSVNVDGQDNFLMIANSGTSYASGDLFQIFAIGEPWKGVSGYPGWHVVSSSM